MTQYEIILTHLKKAKSITQREALIDYSIQSLTSRITVLRKRGYNIVTQSKKHPVTGQRYARYYMAK